MGPIRYACSPDEAGYDAVVAGGIIIAIVLVLVLPVAIILGGGVAAAAIGAVLKANGERTHEGSELIALND